MLTYANQGKHVGMKVVSYRTNKRHSARRGHPSVEPGTILYCIQYEIGGFFPYSYIDRNKAIKVIHEMEFQGTDNEYYREWNVVNNPSDTMQVW